MSQRNRSAPFSFTWPTSASSLSLHNEPGRVFLVGAGPGEPGYITARGLELLRTAEVLVYDALVDKRLLSEAPSKAERIDAGKRAKEHRLSQDQINELLLERAQRGLRVVRLKGGDPVLFGRGAEEAAYVAHSGIRVEIVPGITSGVAAPLCAGIPVTHREHASTVSFVTAHEDPTKGKSSVDYEALARMIAAGGTVCFYMGMSRLGAIAGRLIEAELPGSTPVALVQWGATPKQRSLRCTLENAEQSALEAGLGAPAIVVVGEVAGLSLPGMDFYTARALFGQRILITRTRHQASELRRKLTGRGALVIEAPTIQLISPPSFEAVDEALWGIEDYDWLVLTSVNGVEAVARRLEHLGLDARHFAGVQFAAIGEATAEACHKRLGIRPDLVPTRFVAESLADEIIARQRVAGKRFLLLRADIARPALPETLREAGAEVTELTAYETKLAESLPESAIKALEDREVDWVTFTSSSTARNLVHMLGDRWELLKDVKIASIGPITSEAAQKLGLKVTLEAEKSTIPALVQALVEASRKSGSAHER